MEIFNQIAPCRERVRSWRRQGLSVGVVPTMGFLHAGHGSLIERAVRENDRVVVTVFVNPTQFAPTEDLASYPRDFAADRAMCGRLGAAAVFAPEPAEMYPEGFRSEVRVLGMADHLCGRSRPTHFQGVCTVVLKLLHATEPHRAYFGLKDAQQFLILSRLVKDLDLDVGMVGCPIVREPDGLAMSSRNSYLSPEERRAATVLSRALAKARELLDAGVRRAADLTAAMAGVVASEPLARLDYAEVVDTGSLAPVEVVDRPVLAALAVLFGRTRLIDNLVFDPGAAAARAGAAK